MALSRIWSAFIIIAIVVAGIKCFVTDNNKTIFNSMIIGKAGDTIKMSRIDSATAPSEVLQVINSGKVFGKGQEKNYKCRRRKITGISPSDNRWSY